MHTHTHTRAWQIFLANSHTHTLSQIPFRLYIYKETRVSSLVSRLVRLCLLPLLFPHINVKLCVFVLNWNFFCCWCFPLPLGGWRLEDKLNKIFTNFDLITHYDINRLVFETCFWCCWRWWGRRRWWFVSLQPCDVM